MNAGAGAPPRAPQQVKRFRPARGEAATKAWHEKVAEHVRSLRPGPTPLANVVSGCVLAVAVARELEEQLQAAQAGLTAQAMALQNAGRKPVPVDAKLARLLSALKRKASALLDVLGSAPEEAITLLDGLDERFPLPEPAPEAGTPAAT